MNIATVLQLKKKKWEEDISVEVILLQSFIYDENRIEGELMLPH
jgi:hypothetical protein